MRRFSQRSPLVTLHEINVTPLIDLAFTLLIIFIIISPSIRSQTEQGMKLDLPRGGAPTQAIDPQDVVTISMSPRGEYELNGRLMSLDQIENILVQAHRLNPELVVFLRADSEGRVREFYALLDRCLRNGITRVNFRTAADSP